MKATQGVMLITAALFSSFTSSAEIKFNGFASFVVGQTLEQGDELYEFEDTLNFKSESRFGLQAHVELSQGLTATAQLIARGSDDFGAEFEWAFLSYKPSANNSFYLGRIRIPFYLQSEYLEAGYAYHWLRPPGNVYNSRFNSWDGVGWVNKHNIYNGVGQFQLQLGHLQDDELRVRPREFASIDLSGVMAEYKLHWRNWQARLGYLTTEITVTSELNTFFDVAVSGLVQSGLTVPDAYIENFQLKDDNLTFYSASLFYDNARFFVGAETTKSVYQDLSINPDTAQYYVTAGVVNDQWTYHFSFGETDNKRRQYNELVKGLSLDAGQEAALSSLTDSFTSTAPLSGEQSEFYSVGINYQFHYSAVLKADYTRYQHRQDPSANAELISLAIDLVF